MKDHRPNHKQQLSENYVSGWFFEKYRARFFFFAESNLSLFFFSPVIFGANFFQQSSNDSEFSLMIQPSKNQLPIDSIDSEALQAFALLLGRCGGSW